MHYNQCYILHSTECSDLLCLSDRKRYLTTKYNKHELLLKVVKTVMYALYVKANFGYCVPRKLDCALRREELRMAHYIQILYLSTLNIIKEMYHILSYQNIATLMAN